MDFLDEYKSVMEKYTGLKVLGSVSEEGDAYYIDYGHGFYARLWYENGGYSFAEEERGKVWPGGFFFSRHIDLTQKVMLNYTVSILRHALGFESLGLPMDIEELPEGWRPLKNKGLDYIGLVGPNGERLDFVTGSSVYCVPLAWLYDVSPSELLHAYMLPYGGPLLRRWVGRPYVR